MPETPVPPQAGLPVDEHTESQTGTSGGFIGQALANTKEGQRLASPDLEGWRRFGPYVSERSWGTVREDYSANGDAWKYFPHEHARKKAYRWGEDGMAGICDRYQVMAFAFAFWNEQDPILKERLFGLVPEEANHGEDVKEYYFYLDNLPSHAYMRWLYKYPQRAFPYQQLIDENRRRHGQGPEFELLDTGIFDDDRYFDVFVEYAKADVEDVCIRVVIENRGPEAASIHVLPHLWFRNTWSWGSEPLPRPRIDPGPSGEGFICVRADDQDARPPENLLRSYKLGARYLLAEPDGQPLFCDNETNAPAVYGPWAQSQSAYTKDAFHRYVINGEADAVNPRQWGTKSAVHYKRLVPAGGSVVLRFRLQSTPPTSVAPLQAVDAIVKRRKAEADEFYAALAPPKATADERLVQRQALAGLLWSKQIYLFDVARWASGDNPSWPPPAGRANIRNVHWQHLNSMRIMLVPDKWEYPWFAAWDLAFHAVTMALIDPAFAKEQLWMLLFEQFLHPCGQIPAYEWEFSDLNPPVHAWAVWRVYNMERHRTGHADRAFLERCFHKLLLNFSFWVNKVDREGNNVFEGGFLGLDNITVIDRSQPLPAGATLEQSDGTGWMGMFCLQLMRMALELANENPVYEGLATKFFQHYVYVAAAMKHMGGRDYSLWDEEEGFFYDVLRCPDGHFDRFRVRSMVGLIPLFAVERLEEKWIAPFTEFKQDLHWFLLHRRNLLQGVCEPIVKAEGITHLLAVFTQEQLRQVLTHVLDPDEFMSPFGMRSLSKLHEQKPFRYGDAEVRYEPAESSSKLKGGNSNWRGPLWFPTAFLTIETLRKLGTALGPEVVVPSDGTTGGPRDLWAVAEDQANRMIRLFTRNENGERPVHGQRRKFQDDPHWKDLPLFYEYFHAETGEGLGASHQTGWTALVASLIDEWRRPPWKSSRTEPVRRASTTPPLSEE
ncbi:MAG: glucosidase [Deltaproteobacteria bacterium]|nr:glucosidase [Deltaproteobacteria bacterium]